MCRTGMHRRASHLLCRRLAGQQSSRLHTPQWKLRSSLLWQLHVGIHAMNRQHVQHAAISPQQARSPLVRKPQLWRPPAETWVKVSSGTGMSTGVELSVRLPSPSWPNTFEPAHTSKGSQEQHAIATGWWNQCHEQQACAALHTHFLPQHPSTPAHPSTQRRH